MDYIDKYVMVYAYVPEHFLSCKELSYLDKLIYIRIVGFCRNEEYNYSCFASNKYFAKLFGVSPKSISVTIGKLKRLGYINVTYLRSDTLVKERSIILTSNVWCEISNNDSLIEEEVITYKKEYNNKDNNKKILNNKGPVISYDTDGVMLWSGKRCESIPLTEEEQLEMDKLLEEIR